MIHKLKLFDYINFIYIMIISLIVALSQFDDWYIFELYHFAGILALILIHYAYVKFNSKFWTVVKHWIILICVLMLYKETHYIVPRVTDNILYDLQLRSIDAIYLNWLVNAIYSIRTPILSDILSVCYWMYFINPVILGYYLHKKNKMKEFETTVSVLLIAWYVSYLIYFLVPAIGPIWFNQMEESLKGVFISDFAYKYLILGLQKAAHDVFPSGHTLITIITLYFFRKHWKEAFWFMMPIGSGLIIATIYFDYHYAIDVVASFLLAPIILYLGNKLCRFYVKTKYTN